MAEVPRQLTQAEIDRILFNQRLGIQPTPSSIQNLQQRTSGTVTPIPQNLFQRMAGGASAAGQFVNQAGTAADIAKLFPGYTGQSQVNIPTGFNFAPKQAPTGEVIPGGLQTNQINVNQLLSAIKPADVLGLTGAQQAYTDIGMGKAPKPMDVLDIAGLGAVGYGAGKGLLKVGKNAPVGMSIQDAPGLLQTAPKSDIGFYSAVEQAAMASPRKQGAGQAFLNDISKGQDVRADEIKWLGLDDFLKGKQNVTKQEVQDYIANNRVNVQEVRSTIPRLPGEGMPGDQGAFLPKFASYTLPGGENYRELLLTMPNKNMGGLDAAQIQAGSLRKQTTDLMADWKRISEEKPGSPEAVAAYAKVAESRKLMNEAENAVNAMKEGIRSQTYSSSHFDQPNILAHLRVNDRVDADGKKMLLIEEVQSDWHQAGRDKGYKGQLTSLPDDYFVSEMKRSDDDIVYEIRKKSDPNVLINRDYNRQSAINGAVNLLNETVMGVPDAPFKDTWYQLALKRAIQHAAENGYDRIGLTTGSQQAARFDLSKQVDNLLYIKNADGTYRVSAQVQGRGQMIGESIPEGKLSDYVGKEVAEKMSKGSGKQTEVAGKYDPVSMTSSKQYMTELSGGDLKIGGEGMKKYYDEIYPKFLDKYGKKWGARIGETRVNTVMEANPGSMIPKMGNEPVRYLDVTPEMKAGVSKGQPLFQAAPIVGTGLLGSQQDERR
jgi:hypothetical protein